MLHDDLANKKAYLVGGGIASLAAAVFMIRDARMRGENIHIFDEDTILGGALDASGNATDGYVMRGGRMFDYEQYPALLNLLSQIPSVANPQVTAKEEILTFNERVHTDAHARLIDKEGKIVDVSTMGFNEGDRLAIIKLLAEPESLLGTHTIGDLFSDHFFNTNFWYMWSTMFAFQIWHSAVEFRRYMKLFMHEFPRINTLSGVKRTLYNQYDSIVLPIVNWLKFKGVRFELGCKVTGLDFLQELAEEAIVNTLHYQKDGVDTVLEIHQEDMVIVTNGSMTEASTLGSMATVPAIRGKKDGGAWTLWENMASQSESFGNPDVFCNDISKTLWESFTVTCAPDNTFLEKIEQFSGNRPGTGALMTFKDSGWMLSIVIAYQPHFLNQPEGVTVFWGYGLSAFENGDFVQKRMIDCTGTEILTELMGQLHMEDYTAEMIRTANCIPCIMPFITSQFMPRKEKDRPRVRPKGYYNLAFAGQFVEIPEGVVFTVEYSVRTAMMAVYDMLEMDKKKIPPYYNGDETLGILFDSLKTLNK